MEPTAMGVVAIAAAAFLFRAPPSRLLCLTLFMIIFGASAAAQLSALGGASAPPAQVVLGLEELEERAPDLVRGHFGGLYGAFWTKSGR